MRKEQIARLIARGRALGLLAGVALGGPAVAQTEPAAGAVLQECAACPEMVVLAPGVFMMGSPEGEPFRTHLESPQHPVVLPGFAIGAHEVTVGEYRAFAEATNRPTVPGCPGFKDGAWTDGAEASWAQPPHAQTDAHPVVCVSWDDATAYAAWLSETTGARYRLPSEAEWEYAARAGVGAAYPWGAGPEAACDFANVADATALEAGYAEYAVSCRDGALHSAPVGAYQPNAFGLSDMIGNVREWVADCPFENYNGAPADGSAWLDPTDACQQAPVRGGSWTTNAPAFRSADRYFYPRATRLDDIGFRVVRELADASGAEEALLDCGG